MNLLASRPAPTPARFVGAGHYEFVVHVILVGV